MGNITSIDASCVGRKGSKAPIHAESSDVVALEEMLASRKDALLSGDLMKEMNQKLIDRFVCARAILVVHVTGLSKLEIQHDIVHALSFLNHAHRIVLDIAGEYNGVVLQGIGTHVQVVFRNCRNALSAAFAMRNRCPTELQSRVPNDVAGLCFALGYDHQLWVFNNVGCVGKEAVLCMRLSRHVASMFDIAVCPQFAEQLNEEAEQLPASCEGYHLSPRKYYGVRDSLNFFKFEADNPSSPSSNSSDAALEPDSSDEVNTPAGTPSQKPDSPERRTTPSGLILEALDSAKVQFSGLTSRISELAEDAYDLTARVFVEDPQGESSSSQKDTKGLMMPQHVRFLLSSYPLKMEPVRNVMMSKFSRRLAIVVTRLPHFEEQQCSTNTDYIRVLESMRIMREIVVHFVKRLEGGVVTCDPEAIHGRVVYYFKNPAVAVQAALLINHEFVERENAYDNKIQLRGDFKELEARVLAMNQIPVITELNAVSGRPSDLKPPPPRERNNKALVSAVTFGKVSPGIFCDALM
eukprot:c12131_g1_i1.p1 GENE.c12131_g1_i1~~c12131_g1_i1.p1  ORF type:complete len:523 (+),score=97.48 c12131_g1_i1:67-1635(+)